MFIESPSPAISYDLNSHSFYAAPDETLNQMRIYDPVYWHSELESWILTRYDDIHSVIRDSRYSVNRNGKIGKGGSETVQEKLNYCNDYFTQWMVFSDPPRHTRIRKLVSGVFTPQVINGLKSLIQCYADELIDAVINIGRLDIVDDFATPLPVLVTSHFLGIPRQDITKLKQWSSDMFMLFGAGFATDDIIEFTYYSLLECKQYFDALIAIYKKNPEENVISKLIATEVDGDKLSDEELTSVCITLMAGAYETTTYLIANGILALLQHPHQLHKLRENPTLIDSAVEELLRYCGPAFSIVRVATVDCQIGNQLVKSGQKVYCILHAANHDRIRFANPEILDIERKDNRHLGLGLGIHFCLGAMLTRLETKIAVNSIIQRLDNLSLDTDNLLWIPNLAMRGVYSLPVRFDKT
ncbi:MAG: cytochrome P450 [Scytonematopsis contorta HA4267-MV1]|jgi:cytochrome P450|nr:cytochrome P450 [Scytonematopsis contorta HA4267-MV1]